jgi:predicted nuclease of predicted toxin-antitoxin system
MKLLADMHISPRSVVFLRSLGHDVVRIPDVLPVSVDDQDIVLRAIAEDRIILTQDLDFSAIIALMGRKFPSLISLRLSSSRVEHVNAILQKVLPEIEQDVLAGAIVSVEDQRIRRRPLPVN